MIILRSKNFADLPTPSTQMGEGTQDATLQDLRLEQMKMQRALMQNQRQRQKIQAQESRDRLKTLQMRQRAEAEKDEQESKNQIQTKKLEKADGAQNVNLYKTKSKTVDPVPMK